MRKRLTKRQRRQRAKRKKRKYRNYWKKYDKRLMNSPDCPWSPKYKSPWEKERDAWRFRVFKHYFFTMMFPKDNMYPNDYEWYMKQFPPLLTEKTLT